MNRLAVACAVVLALVAQTLAQGGNDNCYINDSGFTCCNKMLEVSGSLSECRPEPSRKIRSEGTTPNRKMLASSADLSVIFRFVMGKLLPLFPIIFNALHENGKKK